MVTGESFFITSFIHQGLPLSRQADRIGTASDGGANEGEERIGGIMGKLLGGD